MPLWTDQVEEDMNIFEELREEAKGLVEPGKEDQLIHLICSVIRRVGHNVGVSGEVHMNDIHKHGAESDDELTQATAEFLIGNSIDSESYNLGKEFE